MTFIIRYWLGVVDDNDADEVQRRYSEKMWCAHSSRIACLYIFSHEHVCTGCSHVQRWHFKASRRDAHSRAHTLMS